MDEARIPAAYRAGVRLRRMLMLAGLLCLAMLLIAACSPQAEPTPSDKDADAESTDAAPDFEITLYGTESHEKGELLRMSDLKGKPVVVNFWFPSCPPCVAEMPDLERVYQNHKADGLEFIGVQLVGLDTAEDGQQFIDEIGITYAVGADEDDIISKYRVIGFPMTVFVDKDQNIVRRWQGVLDEEKMEELVAEILN